MKGDDEVGKRKTNEEFIKEVFNLVGGEYTFLEEYINNRTKIKCRHNTCGHVYNVQPSNFLIGRRCPKCAGNIKKTDKEFIDEIYKLAEKEYVFLEEYKGANTKIKCKHNECEHEWYIAPATFINQGVRCPQCMRPNHNRDTAHFKQEVYELVGSEYSVLGEYTRNDSKIKMEHNNCGYVFNMLPSNFLSGQRCPQCMRPNYNRDTKQFKQEVYEIVGDEYEFLEEYVNNFTKIKCRHNICGCEWKITPVNFLRGRRCPECFGTKRKTTEEFKEEIYHLLDDEYSVLGEYISNNTKIKIIHNECGNVWSVFPSNILQGQRCPRCIESKGEGAIRKYLQVKDINFQQEYSFDDLKGLGGNPLRFDFAILDNNNLMLLIEYDGEFHYKDIFEDGALELQQIHDERKNQYCKDNDIPLLRIPYWVFDNIEQILEEWLDKYKLLHKDKTKEIA